MNRKKWMGMIVVFMFVSVLAGCGSPKADINIFMSHEYQIPEASITALEADLNEKLNGEFTVDVISAPLYSAPKIMLEYAAGEDGIVVLPYKDIKNYTENGAHMPLDDYFDKAQYEEGVMDGYWVEKVDGAKKKEEKYVDHPGEYLYALPTVKLPLMEKHGLVQEEWFVAIPGTTPNMEQSVKIMQLLAEKP